jgi:hypothetical protein
MNVNKIFQLLTISGKYKLKGTGGDTDILYSSDYDLAEYWKGGVSGIHYIEKVFKDKFRKAMAEPSIFITDFKCGEINGKPVRWDKKTIKSGIVKQYSRKITFCEALQQKSTIKMDVIALIDGIYKEFSCNYKFNFGGITNYETENVTKEELLDDLKDYYKEGNSFKALRRLYSFVKINKREPSVVKALQEYFNSAIGRLNQCKNQTEILILMLEQNFRRPKKIDLVKNLEWIKSRIPEMGLMKKEIIKSISLIQKLKMGEMDKGLDFLLDFFKKMLDEKTRMWIAENKNISYYIK